MRHVLTFVLAAILATVSSSPATAADEAGLLDGVRVIAAPGVPGPLCVFGKEAFALAVGGGKKGVVEPVVAAARWGRGRVVAFGHTGYFGGGALATEDTGRLMSNAVRWAGGTKRKCRVAVLGAPHLLAHLKAQGLPAEAVTERDWRKDLAGHAVLCADATRLRSDADRQTVRGFVRGGGGLVTASLGWGWSQLNPGKSLAEEHPGNLLLGEAGIVWADGTLQRTAGAGYAVEGFPSPLTHAGRALDLLEGASGKPGKEIVQAGAVAVRALRNLPRGDRQLLPRLARLAEERAGRAVPTPRNRLGPGQALERVILAHQVRRTPWGKPREIRAHRSARHFPGAPGKEAPRVSREVPVDLGVPGWLSTALYAPPGELLKISAPEDVTRHGLRVRIGCHKDLLWQKDAWARVPEITHSWGLTGSRTEIASPYGGLVYVEVPAGRESLSVPVRIDGAVEAPSFVLGRTDPEEWQKTIRHRAAPWAELGTEKIVLTVPSRLARALADPRPVLRFWERVMDACADLAARPRARARPERFVADVQISVGYMHAGYPIMTHLDAAEAMLHLPSLKGKGPHGYWGLYHEMGHNHQSRDWTFDGAVEVTVNLFTLYVCETVCGIEDGHQSVTKGPAALARYLADGRKFSQWKSKPFLALFMYIQLQKEFGWDAFKKVFAEYRVLPQKERPNSDDEKRDQWMVRLSRTVGRNLGPFFTAWGVPTSEKARASIAALPAWMPKDWPR